MLSLCDLEVVNVDQNLAVNNLDRIVLELAAHRIDADATLHVEGSQDLAHT